MVLGVPLVNQFTLERFGGTARGYRLVKARTAHDRLGLTHIDMVRGERRNSKQGLWGGGSRAQDEGKQRILEILNLEDNAITAPSRLRIREASFAVGVSRNNHAACQEGSAPAQTKPYYLRTAPADRRPGRWRPARNVPPK